MTARKLCLQVRWHFRQRSLYVTRPRSLRKKDSSSFLFFGILGMEDANGILFIHFPIVELAAALARSTMTVKRSLNELEDAGLILRVRQGFGEPNKIYVLIPKKEDSRL